MGNLKGSPVFWRRGPGDIRRSCSQVFFFCLYPRRGLLWEASEEPKKSRESQKELPHVVFPPSLGEAARDNGWTERNVKATGKSTTATNSPFPRVLVLRLPTVRQQSPGCFHRLLCNSQSPSSHEWDPSYPPSTFFPVGFGGFVNRIQLAPIRENQGDGFSPTIHCDTGTVFEFGHVRRQCH